MKLTTSVLAFVLCATTVSGFAPRAATLKRAVSRLAKPTDWVADDMKKVGKDDSESKDWVADAMNEAGKAGLHSDDFVVREIEEAGKAGALRAHEKEKKKDRYEDVTKDMKATGKATDDWVARDMKQAGSAKSPTEEAASMAKKLEHKLDERREKDYNDVVDRMKETGKAGKDSKDWIAQDMNRVGRSESYLDSIDSSKNNASYQRSDWQKKALDRDQIIKDMTVAGKGPQEWIAQDMKKAGAPDPAPLRPRSHEKTKNQLIEEDMVKAGRLGGTDWVRKNMEQAGKAESPADKLNDGLRKLEKAIDDQRKHAFDDVAEGMKKAGREGSETKDWVATDMKTMGMADSSTDDVSSWTKKLGFALDKEREHGYDDIEEDMEKTGKAGDHSKDWVARDMENAGHGESLLDKIYSVGRDFSYKLSDWQKKTFDLESIYEEMKEAGNAKPSDAVAQDMKAAGKFGSSAADTRIPAPKKQLSEWATNEDKWVAEDMADLGKADASPRAWEHRAEKKSTQKMSDLVAEDMRMVGKAHDESVVEDMKMTGLAHFFMGSAEKKASGTQKQRETEVFNKAQEVSRKKRQDAAMAAQAAEDVLAAESTMSFQTRMAAMASEDYMVTEAEREEALMDAPTAEDVLAAESTMSYQTKMAAMASEDAMAAEADKAALAVARAEESKEKQHSFVRHLLHKMATPWRKWSEL
jgi:hypothetical protein